MFTANANFAASTLGVEIGVDDLSLSMVSGGESLFPSSGQFRAVLWDKSYSSPFRDSTREIVLCTFNSGTSYDIVRGQEGTVAKAWAAGDNIALTITAGKLTELERVAGHGVRTITANDDMNLTDQVVLINAVSSDVTLSLPSAAEPDALNKKYTVKRIDSSVHVVTVVADGVETIDGQGSIDIAVQYERISFVSDGIKWHLI